MIDLLETDPSFGLREGSNRHQLRVVAVRLDVKLLQIFRRRTLAVLYLDDPLVLIVGLLDQINIVLRIRGAEQALQLHGRNSVEAGPIAIDLDVKVRGIAKKIGTRRSGKNLVVGQLRPQCVGRGVNFRRVNTAQCVGVSAESAPGPANVDGQDRLWVKRRKNARDGAGGFAQVGGSRSNRRTIFNVFEKDHGKNTGRLNGAARHSEVFINRWIRLKHRIEFVLKLTLLLRRRAFLNNKETANYAAIAGRQKSEGKPLKEKQNSKRANHVVGGREPAVIKKPAERSTVES